MNVELLLKIKAAVLEEPLRLNMNRWVINPAAQAYYQNGGVPPCNTVACLAGWAVALTKNLRGKALFDFHNELGTNIESEASELLNLSDSSRQALFYVQNWPYEFADRLTHARGGTPEYARITADRIDHFIATEGRE